MRRRSGRSSPATREIDRIETEIREALPNTEVIIHIDPCSKALEPCTTCAQEDQKSSKTP